MTTEENGPRIKVHPDDPGGVDRDTHTDALLRWQALSLERIASVLEGLVNLGELRENREARR